ncbi:MAG: GNAT family N-acetyltransferase [Rhodocyclaceae bacterium]|nr:GNAT family N-acetyltransferase [Rhodocyclaceae bacterium]
MDHLPVSAAHADAQTEADPGWHTLLAARPAAPWRIEPLGPFDDCLAIARLITHAFQATHGYPLGQILDELMPRSGHRYRQFFVARRGEQVLGVAGIKAADWASDTHILFRTAVAPEARGQGLARALVDARLAWLDARLPGGRVLVSCRSPGRFAERGFVPVGAPGPRGWQLMILDRSEPDPGLVQ